VFLDDYSRSEKELLLLERYQGPFVSLSLHIPTKAVLVDRMASNLTGTATEANNQMTYSREHITNSDL
jgi:hypothetical protein